AALGDDGPDLRARARARPAKLVPRPHPCALRDRAPVPRVAHEGLLRLGPAPARGSRVARWPRQAPGAPRDRPAGRPATARGHGGLLRHPQAHGARAHEQHARSLVVGRVEYDDVWKQFPTRDAPAVRGLTLDVADGEFLVLLGPSGCGKTTALRMLAGLEHPDRGDIRIEGRSVLRLEPKDRDVALVFQSYALYPHISARDTLHRPLPTRTLRPLAHTR